MTVMSADTVSPLGGLAGVILSLAVLLKKSDRKPVQNVKNILTLMDLFTPLETH